MKFAVSMVLGAWILFAFSSCSEMLQGLRAENDEINAEIEKDREDKDGEIYGYKPKNLSGLTANNVRSQEPPVMRNYGRKLSSLNTAAEGGGSSNTPEYSPGRRATREDFIDKTSENSLWDSQGQNNFLFSHNRRRETGDMISADIEKELRREIQFQLWMTLPPDQRKIKRGPASTGTDALKTAAGAPVDPNAPKGAAKPDKGLEEKGKDAAEEAAKTNMAPGGKDDDLIRMEVVENLGNGLVRVVGQKRVIYRGVSRIVEVMALANNKDIDDNNRVKSGTFLDMQTQVVQ